MRAVVTNAGGFIGRYLTRTLLERGRLAGRPPALYRRIVAVDHESLFAGLVQPIGPTITLVEVQARWMALVLAGRIALPDRDTMMREVERHRARVASRYVNAARYTLEVDFRGYVRDLARDMQRQPA